MRPTSLSLYLALPVPTSLSLYLDLSANAIPPLGFEHLPALAPSLARLSLAQCQLEVVPAELATLSRLTHLDLAGNSIVAGWRHLRALPQLVELQPPEARQHMQRG